MGDGDTAPVDTRLRLKGVGKVRVADASVIPEIPVSALNAPTMMIAYRAADFILADAGKHPAGGKPAARSQSKRTGGKAGARQRKTAR
jgi:choline dehydrogenase